MGHINYKPRIKGTKGLNSASSSNIKAQSNELVELDLNILRDYKKISDKTNELIEAWSERQNQFICAGVSRKRQITLKYLDKR